MVHESSRPPRVIIVGAGIAGLSAAWHLQQAMPDADVKVLEASQRVGGKLRTIRQEGFVVELGPDAFIREANGAAAVAHAWGIGDQLVAPSSQCTMVHLDGRFYPIPAGWLLTAPARLDTFLSSTLFSWKGRLRALADLVLPPRRQHADESLASLVRRRLGAEVLDRLAEPMVAGIYGAEPEELSLAATFPQLLKWEQEHGSLIRGALAARRKRRQASNGKASSPFLTLRNGMEELARAAHANLAPGTVRFSVEVKGICCKDDGSYLLDVAGITVKADAVILAVPARAAARLLEPVAPWAARRLGSIEQPPTINVTVAFPRKQASNMPAAAGFMVPAVSGSCLRGATFVSQKWPHRVPNTEWVMIRTYLRTTPDLVDMSEPDLLQLALDHLRQHVNIPVEPHRVWVGRWCSGIPQYRVGHLDKIQAVEKDLQDWPGLQLAGASYHGISVNACVKSGRQAAASAAKHLHSPRAATALRALM